MLNRYSRYSMSFGVLSLDVPKKDIGLHSTKRRVEQTSIPSGELTSIAMENHHFSWENPL